MPNNFLAPALLTLLLASGAHAATAPDLESTIAGQLEGSAIRVVDYEGIVILRGTVVSAEQRTAAERLARESGVVRVANLLTIAPPATDEALRVRVEREIMSSRLTGVSDVSIRTEGGVVYIRGNVAEDLHRTLIGQLGRIPGVRQVMFEPLAD